MVSNNYKVQIKNRTYDLLGRDSDYLPAQLKWCLDKKLLQQALVLIESQTAVTLVNNNIIIGSEGRNHDYPFFGDWVKYSLCKSENEDSIYVRFDKEPLLSFEKSEAISNDTMEVCDENYKMSYFTTYKPYFNDIDVNLGEGRVINEILKLKNTNWDATKYYEQKKGVKRGLGVYYLNNDIYNLGLSYKKGLKPIPVNQELVKKNVNRVYLKDLYVLMYIYKGLKRYRNSVAHASEVDDQNIPNLTRSEVEKWIELFIIRLDKFLKDVAPICGGIFR